MSNNALLFVPAPTVTHVSPAVEAAKLLLTHDHRLSITFCLINMPFDPKLTQYNSSLPLSSHDPRLVFVQLPDVQPDPDATGLELFASVVDAQESRVREVAEGIVARSGSGSCGPQLAGFVFDMFCSTMIGTAAEFGVPAFVFSPPSATFLGFLFHVQKLHDEEGVDTTELPDSVGELAVPCLTRPVPKWALPDVVVDKAWLSVMLGHTRRMKEAKGILVNTLHELESYALDSMCAEEDIPPMYPMGPVLNLGMDDVVYDDRTNEIFRWLDGQSESSVVFLCFGTTGMFSKDQVREIAYGLEQSGNRFLWALRRPLSEREPTSGVRVDFNDLSDILPEGFSNRTVETGRVIGWAPQKAILGHKAIGGFVLHCGWNSILESIWFGVQIAVWPLYAEQQLNAFQLAVELELATEIKLSYRMKDGDKVTAIQIERGIRRLMEKGTEKQAKLKSISEMIKKALTVGGSSFSSTDRFIQHLLD